MAGDAPHVVTPIDLGYLGVPEAAWAFLVDVGQPLLIECGPALCLGNLDHGLRSRGIDPHSLGTLLVTHIHLDHAGAAGHLARRGARVLTHPFGRPHLVDPGKLIASSRRVHGDAFDRFYGEPLPCPPELVESVEGGTTRHVGAARVTALETPGHARHHHAWLVEVGGRRIAFAGDVAAMVVPGSQFLSLPTPPPEFDPHAWGRSLDLLEAADPDELWLTHGGRVPHPRAHLKEVRSRLAEELALVTALVRSGVEELELLERYRGWLEPRARAAGVPPQQMAVFVGTPLCRMNLHGIRRWLAS